MMGIYRNVERRKSNGLMESDGLTHNVYVIMVTKVVFLWVTVWTHESDRS